VADIFEGAQDARMTFPLVKEIIGRNLLNVRTERGMPQEALVLEPGISLRHYQNLEAGLKLAGIVKVVLLAMLLKVPVDTLLAGVREEILAELKRRLASGL
jgi:transcriptional regulator with XRE-family HTH domain